jgi:hypothetical protein
MTGYEAAIQEERDAFVRRRQDAKQAQEDGDFHRQQPMTAVIPSSISISIFLLLLFFFFQQRHRQRKGN